MAACLWWAIRVWARWEVRNEEQGKDGPKKRLADSDDPISSAVKLARCVIKSNPFSILDPLMGMIPDLNFEPKKEGPATVSRRGSLESASLFGLSEALQHLFPGSRGLATTATTRISQTHTDAAGAASEEGAHGVEPALNRYVPGGNVVGFEHEGRIDHEFECVKWPDTFHTIIRSERLMAWDDRSSRGVVTIRRHSEATV